ncbi:MULTISPECIES: phage/plasmid primase, P4 family [unclassified Tolypothrix]|nr:MULTISPECIES: phage/plasmid primase, P4 family [unclassified Tolypothrix]
MSSSSEATSSYICARHLEEWVNGSGVSEEITRLNVKTLEDNEEIAQHLDWKKYKHTAGWWCSGINPRNGLPMGKMHGQFKPNEPLKLGSSDKSKPAKYISSKAQHDAICLDTGNRNYWSEIIGNVSIPIFVTEGCKKAGAGLTNGYPTLALCGVDMGLDDGTLVSHLELFANPERNIYLCFDADIVRKTPVRKALIRLANVLCQQKCIVRVVIWEETRGKGMDDFLVTNGKAAFDVEIAKAQDIHEFKRQTVGDQASKSQKGKNNLPAHSVAAEIIASQVTNLKFDSKISRWTQYQNGYWSIAIKESVLQRIVQKLKEIYPDIGFSASYPEGVIKMLIPELLFDAWNEQPKDLLPFKNGVLDLKSKQMMPHSPDYYFRSILDREHDVCATDWNVIEEWMDFVFDNNHDQKRLLLCWYAAVLRGMWKLHRFALITGLGGTGKSTAMKLATELVGKRFSHSVTLSSLNNHQFQAGNIYGKRLVCINDADDYRGNIEILKNITGGDEITIEHKYEMPFTATYTGMVMITANHLVFNASDSGLDRRMIIFKFNRPVPKVDPDFSASLSAQISGFTNYLLSIPEEEINQTLIYKVDESGMIGENELEFLLQTNSVADWLNNNYVYDRNNQIPIGKDKDRTDQLYGDYCSYCYKTRSKMLTNKQFSPEIIRLGREKLEKVKTSSGFVIRGLKRDDSGGVVEAIIRESYSK